MFENYFNEDRDFEMTFENVLFNFIENKLYIS